MNVCPYAKLIPTNTKIKYINTLRKRIFKVLKKYRLKTDSINKCYVRD